MTAPPIARAFWITAPGRGEIREQPLATCREGEVRVRALYSAVSRGTESLVLAGRVPPSEYTRMRAPFQEGAFPAPVKYGYMSVGRVEQGPTELTGRTVFCLHPHQTLYVVPAGAVTPLPDGLPPERAVLAANMETALNALWDAAPMVGERITVVGAGVVGCLAAGLCARIPGVRVELVDTNPRRRHVAETLGAGFCAPRDASPEADLVIHASGTPEGLRSALELAGNEARVVEMSWYGTTPVTLPLGEAFHARRLTLRSTQVGRLPPAMTPRWDHQRRLGKALELLDDGRLDVLIGGDSPFDDLPRTLPAVAADQDSLCHRIVYP